MVRNPQSKCTLKDTVVAIMAEGKEVALAIGRTAMSTDEIASKNKGRSPRQSNIHCFLGSVTLPFAFAQVTVVSSENRFQT